MPAITTFCNKKVLLTQKPALGWFFCIQVYLQGQAIDLIFFSKGAILPPQIPWWHGVMVNTLVCGTGNTGSIPVGHPIQNPALKAGFWYTCTDYELPTRRISSPRLVG